MNHLKKYGWIYLIGAALVLGIVFRIIMPWETVFTANGVLFQGVDCYYYMHLADLISQNNMQLPQFDSYYDFPMGLDYSQLPSSYNAYGYFIAMLTWIFTFGHPTPEALDIIGALHPAILGILSLIPIFVIAWKLTNNKAIAGLTMVCGAIMPGEFFARSMLGAADTHCLEIFLFGYIAMFTVLAINATRSRYIHVIMASISLFLYLVIWQGAVIASICLAGFGILYQLIGKAKGNLEFKTASTICEILGMATILYIIFSGIAPTNTLLLALVPFIGMIVFTAYSWLLRDKNNWIYFTPVAILSLILGVMMFSIQYVGFYFYPSWFTSIARQAWNIVSWHVNSTTSEELPLLITLGTVTPEVPYSYFGVCWYLFFIGLGYLLYKTIKENNINIMYVLIWSALMLIPTLAMRRFAYYLAFNVCIVAIYMLWELFRYWITPYIKKESLNEQ